MSKKGANMADLLGYFDTRENGRVALIVVGVLAFMTFGFGCYSIAEQQMFQKAANNIHERFDQPMARDLTLLRTQKTPGPDAEFYPYDFVFSIARVLKLQDPKTAFREGATDTVSPDITAMNVASNELAHLGIAKGQQWMILLAQLMVLLGSLSLGVACVFQFMGFTTDYQYHNQRVSWGSLSHGASFLVAFGVIALMILNMTPHSGRHSQISHLSAKAVEHSMGSYWKKEYKAFFGRDELMQVDGWVSLVLLIIISAKHGLLELISSFIHNLAIKASSTPKGAK